MSKGKTALPSGAIKIQVVKDAIVVGGGPAGSAVAIQLARGGMDVVLLEASGYDTFRAGETLPPAARTLLESLRLWDRLEGRWRQSSPGIVSIWGSDTPYHKDFIFSPYGPGWHVDRALFDRMMATAAEDAGAIIIRGCLVTAATRGHQWRVEAATPFGSISIAAAFLIDAAGRSGWPGRLAQPRRVHDRLVAFAGIFDRAVTESAGDQRTLIEAAPDGWWYCAPIPGGRMVSAFFTDSDLPVGRRRGGARKVQDLLMLAPPHTTNRLRGHKLRCARAFAAAGSLAAQVRAYNWAAVGSAACTFDPLSSQGLLHALSSANEVASAFLQSGRDREQSLERYANGIRGTFDNYLKAYAYHYGRESRWPESKFWQRRQGAAVTGKPQ